MTGNHLWKVLGYPHSTSLRNVVENKLVSIFTVVETAQYNLIVFSKFDRVLKIVDILINN